MTVQGPPEPFRRVLVTGVTGQDGSYLAESLVAHGCEVHGLVQSHDPARLPDGVVAHQGDLRDLDRVAALVADLRPDAVFNLAGVSSVARSWEEPVPTVEITGTAAVALLDAAWRLQEARGRPVCFVQASSAEIFGESGVRRQNEATPVRPVNPYGAAKALAHHATGIYRSRGLHASSAILFNHESPRRPPRFVARKISRSVAEIAAGRRDLLTLGNLDARRDWGWAPDYVDAMLRMARAEVAEDYVVATGSTRSVRDFVDAAFRCVGRPDWQAEGLVAVDEQLTRPVDVGVQCGDATQARTRLGWSPTVTFEEMVGRMVQADLARL